MRLMELVVEGLLFVVNGLKVFLLQEFFPVQGVLARVESPTFMQTLELPYHDRAGGHGGWNGAVLCGELVPGKPTFRVP